MEINKDKLPEPENVKHDALDKQPIKERAMAQDDNLRMLTEKHDDENLAITFLIVGTSLSFLVENKMASLLFTVGGAVVNALAFIDTNFVFSRLTDHGEEERKRHDLAIEKLQRARDEWNKDQTKRLDFINKRLCEQNKARVYISNADETKLEYDRTFAKQIKPLPPEHELSDFYQPSGVQKNGELLFIALGLGIATYALYKYLK